MVQLVFYDGKSGVKVKDLGSDVVSFDYTVSLNGNGSGSVSIEITDNNKSFLSSLKENSHFLKFGFNKIYGGVVESSMLDLGSGLCQVEWIGVYGWLDKVDSIASELVSKKSVVVPKDDMSLVKSFYADSAVGILAGVLDNLNDAMELRGYSSSVIDYSNVLSWISSNYSSEWDRTFRINSIETPTVANILDSLFSEDEFSSFRISVSDDVNSNFVFFFEFVDEVNSFYIDNDYSEVFDVKFDFGGVKNRAFSVSKGTNLKDQSVIETVDYNKNSVYSSLISDVPGERSNYIRQSAVNQINKAEGNEGNLSFSKYIYADDDYIDVLDSVDFSFYTWENGEEIENIYKGFVVEKSVSAGVVTFSLQLVDSNDTWINTVLSMSSSPVKRILFNQINKANHVGGVAVNRRENTTGWRS